MREPDPESNDDPQPDDSSSPDEPTNSIRNTESGEQTHRRLSDTVDHEGDASTSHGQRSRRIESMTPLPEIVGYHLLEPLGRGAMGVVFMARQQSPSRHVALKMLRDTLASHEEEVRFRNEAEAVAQLRHRNIVQVYDYSISDGHPYFTMELLDGGSLVERMAAERWKEKEAARLIEKLARAIHHAHESGVVHRDVKPDNILFTHDDEPQLTDFGLARREDCDYLTTIPGTRMGTPPYMSPEQARGDSDQVDARTDVWSLGAVLYELLTGQRAFPGKAVGAVIQRVLHEDPVAPKRIRRNLSSDVATICLKCLEKDPDKRYDSALALAEDLRAFLELRPIAARPASNVTRVQKWIRRRPMKAVAMMAILLAVAGAAYGYWHYDAYYATHVSCYGTLRYEWGVPVGVNELTREEHLRRGYAFEITRNGRRNHPHLVRVVDVDGDLKDGFMNTWFEGVLYEPQLTWSHTTYEYDSAGRLTQETSFRLIDHMRINSEQVEIRSTELTPVFTMNYYYDEVSEEDPHPQIATAGYKLPDGRRLNPTLYRFVRNETGLDVRVEFHDDFSYEPLANHEGVFGYRIRYERGLPVEYVCLDKNFRDPMTCLFDFAILKLEYRSDGSLGRNEYLNAERDRVITTWGFSVSETTETDGAIHVRFYDTDGSSPIENTDLSCCGFDIIRNDKGVPVEIVRLDKDGNPIDPP